MTVTTGTENGGENGGRTGVPKVHVIGWPIEHSRSPLIHGHWLQHYNLPGTYTKKAVAPDDFERFIRSFGAAGIAGANVTVPFKEQAFRLADHADAAARAIEAANTLWLQDGELHASNTDGYGFLANLDAGAPGWNAGERPVAVLGAGGAARGVLVVECAMPAAVFTYLFAHKHGREADQVAGIVMLSTLMAFATIPALLSVLL